MPRPDEALLAVAALGVLLLGVLTALDRPAPAPAPVPVRPAAAAPAAPPAGRPVAVAIPALGLDQPLVRLGRQADGSLEVPTDFGAVGVWGGDPAGGGPVVLAGHVDSDRGPAVFFRLRELTPGDRVVVRGADGRPAAYVVDRVEQHAKDAFPTFEVYTGEGLRLVTCGGAFDRRAGSYRDNLVVYASPSA